MQSRPTKPNGKSAVLPAGPNKRSKKHMKINLVKPHKLGNNETKKKLTFIKGRNTVVNDFKMGKYQ